MKKEYVSLKKVWKVKLPEEYHILLTEYNGDIPERRNFQNEREKARKI